MKAELEKTAPQMAAATVMMMMCYFHFKMSCTSERLLKLLSIVLSFVSLLGVIFSGFNLFRLRLLAFFDRFVFGLATKKVAVAFPKGDEEKQ